MKNIISKPIIIFPTIKIQFILFFLLVNTFAYAQMEQYHYKRELTGIIDQWQTVVLPSEMFSKIENDLDDIRLFGITKTDTVEAPFILQESTEKISSTDIPFELINESKNANGYFFTFEIPTQKTINLMELDFREKNFDRKIKLEGSQDLKEWFMIVEEQRILSIKNELTDYSFSKIKFPDSKYKYVRISLEGKKQLHLNAATIRLDETTEGQYNNYPTNSFAIKKDKKKKQTIIDIDLGSKLPVSYLQLDVNNNFDYYRPITIKYLVDSLQTPQGWKYNYRTLSSGTLSSLENNEFKFSSTILQNIKLIIHDHDNAPLNIEKVFAKGHVFELLGRFDQPATYFLTYGNDKAHRPNYDIGRFMDKIPNNSNTVEVGEEKIIQQTEKKIVKPLFENRIWLWGMMILIIGLLGWFTLSMMKKEGNES